MNLRYTRQCETLSIQTRILLKCSWVISCAVVRNHQSEEAWKDRPIWYMYIKCTHTHTHTGFVTRLLSIDQISTVLSLVTKYTNSRISKFIISWHWYKSHKHQTPFALLQEIMKYPQTWKFIFNKKTRNYKIHSMFEGASHSIIHERNQHHLIESQFSA